ncbi:hypothetical protein L218DRAFT_380731 [Marasmius fiardii PR-910]|nr:hypothetical protein L218DRAFT_380731 [Marasmius fiardii PR-910]
MFSDSRVAFVDSGATVAPHVIQLTLSRPPRSRKRVHYANNYPCWPTTLQLFPVPSSSARLYPTVCTARELKFSIHTCCDFPVLHTWPNMSLACGPMHRCSDVRSPFLSGAVPMLALYRPRNPNL